MIVMTSTIKSDFKKRVQMSSAHPLHLFDLPTEMLDEICAYGHLVTRDWGRPYHILHITSGGLFKELRGRSPPQKVKPKGWGYVHSAAAVEAQDALESLSVHQKRPLILCPRYLYRRQDSLPSLI